MSYIEVEMEGYGKIRGICPEVYVEKDGIQRDLLIDEIKERLSNDNSKIIKFFSLTRCEFENVKIKFLLEKEKNDFNNKYGATLKMQNLGFEKYIKESLGDDCRYF